jgi:phosphatidylserine/phosphatidylglycerophosphate/cardiolipin synthase-like enzyme
MFEPISGREYPQKVIPLIESAKNSIDVVVFDWRWYPNDSGASCQLFNQAIIRAVRRGVKIRAVANNDQIIQILKNEGCEAKRLKTTKLVHSKLMIIDKKIIIMGSHNFTQSAFQMNLELSVILSGDGWEDSFLSFFNNLWTL